MSRNRGMSKGVKISIIMVLILLLLAGAVVGGILILGNHSSELPDVDRTTKLEAPKNLAIDDDWLLTFDKVDKAIGYYILIDGQKNLMTKENSVDVSSYATVGMHSFSVRALHSLASFHSDYSEVKQKAKYLTLDTPTSTSLSSLLFSWGRVAEAKSYELLLTDDQGHETKMYSTYSTEISLEDYVAQNPDLMYFDVQVKASAEDRVTGTSNPYIRESEYSDKLRYYKANSISAPVIVADFDDTTYVGSTRSISWVITSDDISSEYVDHFEVWLDGRNLKNIPYAEFNGLSDYVFDMGVYPITDTLGQHEIYILSVPKDGIGATSLRSNTINYIVRDKLASVDGSTIQINKEGSYLVITWDGNTRALGYSIEMQGRLSANDEFRSFEVKNDISDMRYTLSLDGMQASFQEVRARVRAIGQGYIDDADWSEWSSPYGTVTNLNSVGDISVISSDDSVTLSWVGQNRNELYKQYLGAYYIQVFKVEYEGGVPVTKNQVYEFNIDCSIESVVISDRMRAANPTNPIPAGTYLATVITMPNASAGQYYLQSEPAISDVYEYKTRLATPSGIRASRDFTTTDNPLTLSFVGAVGAIRYDVTITNDDIDAINFSITQPLAYEYGDVVVDTTLMQQYLGAKTEPSTYKIAIVAIAEEGQTAVLNSTVGTATYDDMFKHQAVNADSIRFNQAEGSNTVTVSWDAVPTVLSNTGYSYELLRVGSDGALITTFTGDATATTVDLTANLYPGQYVFAIRCKEIVGRYYESDTTRSSIYTYYYNILGTANISFSYLSDEDKILVSMPHFDQNVTGYAIKFGNSAPQMMTINSDGTVSYVADFTQLPLYQKTTVTILAGVKSVASGVAEVQDYIKAIKEISTEFTNDYSVSSAILAINENNKVRTLTITLANGALDFTRLVEWEVLLGDRSMHKEQISGQALKQVMTRNLNELIANGGDLVAGKYTVKATVTSTSGLTAASNDVIFEVYTTLPAITGITTDTVDNAYLQWDVVDGAVSYTVAVKKNGNSVTDIKLLMGEYVVTENGVSRDVIRVSTVDLFTQKGLGNYEFTITAESGSEYVNPSEATYNWNLNKQLATPVASVYKNSDGVVYAHILVSQFASSYRVSVKGIMENGADYVVTADRVNAQQYQDVLLPELKDAGTFLISVVAVPAANADRAESDPCEIKFTNDITADRPSGIAATQSENGVTVSWEAKEYRVWSVNEQNEVSSVTVPQNVSITVSTLTGEYYTYSGSAAEVLSAGSAGNYTFVASQSEIVQGLINFLNEKKQSTYLVYFTATAESNLIADSAQIPTRLAYQVTLGQPTLKLQGEGRLVEDGTLNFAVGNLDADANGVIDVEILKEGVVIVSLYAQSTSASGSERIYTLHGEDMADYAGSNYIIRVRAAQNGIYKASAYSSTVSFNYAKYVGTVSGVIVSQEYTAATGEGETATPASYKLNVKFDALSVACTYTVTMSYGGFTYEFVRGANATEFTLNYSGNSEANAALQVAWGATPRSDLTLAFVISATPVDTTFAEKQDTNYVYAVGKVAAPTNFVFTQNGNEVSVTWAGDANYASSEYTTTYTLNITYKGNSSTTAATLITSATVTVNGGDVPTYTFTIPDNTAPYLFALEITNIAVTRDGSQVAVSTDTTTANWVNTQENGDANVSVDYNPDEGKYYVTVNHESGNGTVFVGQEYTLIIDETAIFQGVVAATNSNKTIIRIDDTATAGKLMNIANVSTTVTYKLIISDAVATTVDGAKLVGVRGTTQSGTLDMPIVINQAPSVILDTIAGTASWDNVTNATKYLFVIKSNSDTVYFTEIGATEGNIIHNFADEWKKLAGGEYTIEVSVANDPANKVYVTSNAKFSQTVTKNNVMVSAIPTYTTYGNGKGDFVTSISWSYVNPIVNEPLPIERFEVSLISVDTGTVYTLDSSKIIVTNNTTNSDYTLTLSGRDLTQTNYPIIGYDPTRTMPVGEYALGLVVKADANDKYSQDSIIEYSGKPYVNKFGVAKISEESSAFGVAPECYFTMNNGEMVMTEQQKGWFNSYEDAYGFNRKYLVVSTLGQDLNLATSYRVTLNGTDLGLVSKQGAAFDFATLQANSNKLSLGSLWTAGENTITIMPTTSSENLSYYAYIDGLVIYTLDSATAIENLTTEYTIVMYEKFSAPSDPRLYIEYDDVAKHNISKVNVTFANSAAGYQYSVLLRYKDYYDSNTEKSILLGSDMVATFAGSQNIGLELYEYLAHLGPHEICFEICQTGIENLSNSQYYVTSKPSVTEWFTYTTSVQEFGTKQVETGRKVSQVTEIVYNNQDENKEYMTNGHLMWNLPINAYSIKVRYSVIMADSSMLRQNSFSAILCVDVDENGQISYRLEENDKNLFYIDSEYVYFDMTKYFYNDSTVLSTVRPDEVYYLAGKYYYQIAAVALDKEGKVAASRIFDPVNKFGFNEYIYKDIMYPHSPTNAVISKDGLLTWDYISVAEDRYSNSEQVFGIRIETKKVSGEANEPIIIKDITTREFDISSYLIAGGANSNAVFVYRISPDDYFLNSKSTKADFAGDYADSSIMPSISASWAGASTINYEITENEDRLRKVAGELSENGASAEFVISMLRVESGVAAGLDGNATYDSIKNMSIDFVDYTFAPIALDIDRLLHGTAERSYSYNMLNVLNEQDEATRLAWIEDNRLISGAYYVKVELRPVNHAYYTSSVANVVKAVKEMWRVRSELETTLTGEYLTTKAKTDATASPVNQNDRNWAETDHKEAKLRFEVNSLVGADGEWHLPSQVTVRVKLWNGTGYSANSTYEVTYNLPNLADLLGNPNITEITSEEGDVIVSRYGNISTYYTVSIDIHKLFDYTENYAADFAGVYHLDWVINDDDVGGESDSQHTDGTTWYSYTRDICHYTVIQTPILDYRLDMQKAGSTYYYILNWALTPNKFSYQVNEDIDYNLNIFAFEQQADGSYLCDTAYNGLDALNKKFFLQKESGNSNTTSYGFKLEKYATNFGTVYQNADGRRCYINENTNIGLELTPNKKYKFYMYLSPKTQAGSNNDPNVFYYLTSETSAPQEYVYKTISPAFSDASVSVKQGDVYVVEGQQNFESAKIYNIPASQYGNGYNNAFELYVYDTQDAAAGTNASWTENQEANGTYLAHHIITTLNNAGSGTQPLYVVQNYVPRKLAALDYWRNSDGSLRQIGTLKNEKMGNSTFTTILLYDFALDELLGDKADVPITYYCKIKSWIDNNEVNCNANLDSSGKQVGLSVYGEDWLKRYITTDANEIANYLPNLASKVVESELADFNVLNPSYYFTFQHTMRFAQPSISKIEILNEAGASDVVGDCVASYDVSSNGVTDGYISSESDENYYFKIYLDNVYNSDPVVTADKYIRLDVAAYPYDSSGNININGTPTESRTVTFKVRYDGTTSYIIISDADGAESGARAMYYWIDSILPNKLHFAATAVMGNPDQKDATNGTNVGGDNTANKFVIKSNSSTQTYYDMARSFADSYQSNAVTLTVKKQYAAPKISLRYDNTTNPNLVSGQYTNKTNGYETNVLSDGGYAGMALNPYLYVDGGSYDIIGAQGGANGYEYQRLSSNQYTKYELIFSYNGRTSSPYIFSTADINSALTRFASAVRGQTNWSYDYSSYSDLYPYETACLYTKLYDFVNSGVAEGGYHGGVVSMSIRVVAPDDESNAGYWVSSAYNEETTLAFSVRLETVQTSFDASKAEIYDEDNLRHMATMYAQNGYYYYYQSKIPFEYKAISKNVKYRVYLTRDNVDGTRLVYSYDTLRLLSDQINGQDKTVWTATDNTFGATNSGNLADILSQNIFGSNYNDAGKNQWLLGGEWNINILAYADSSMNDDYITRGFDSRTRTYQPTLQLVNDVNSVTVKMIVNTTTGEVGGFDENYQSIISYNSSVNRNGNLSVSKAEFTFNNTADMAQKTEMLGFGNLTDSFPTRYKKVLRDFIVTNYVNQSTVIGGKYYYKFRFVVDSNSQYSEFLLDSDSTATFELEYYKQLNENDITVEAMQSDTSIAFSSSVAKINTIKRMNIGLVQNIINVGTQKITTARLQTLDAGENWNFNGSMSFSQSRADCFSSTSYTQSEANNLTSRGYVSSSYVGNIQAGKNYFRFYPVQDPTDAKYNLLRTGFYIERVADFVVPDALCPTVRLTYTTSSEGGGSSQRSTTRSHSCPTEEKVWYDYKVDCEACNHTGKVTVTETVPCTAGCIFDLVLGNSYIRDTCSSCNGSRKCSSCGGKGYTTGGLTGNTKYGCGSCGGSGGGIHIGAEPYKQGSGKCRTCHGSGLILTLCSTCGGRGMIEKSVEQDCKSCNGKGYNLESDWKMETCSTCNGSGTYYTRHTYTYYYASYTYINSVRARYTNEDGCTANASWTYAWEHNHSGSCTRTDFTRRGSSSSLTDLENGISMSGANKVSFAITINCKRYFESYFSRPSASTSISPSVVSYHYESYSGPLSSGTYIGAGSGGSSSGGSSSKTVCSRCGGTGEIIRDGHVIEGLEGYQRCKYCGKHYYPDDADAFLAEKCPIRSPTTTKCSACGGDGYV